MIKKNLWVLFMMMGIISLAGCPAIIVGGAAVGAASGTYFYIDGELKTDYYASFDKTWSAVEKTIADMRGIEVEPVKEIGKGDIRATINDEKVKFDIRYKTKDLTTVAVRVGNIGNKLSSQLIHDKIADNIAKN
ncbi:MAG: DUF3568 family protein [Deltaproteobacteria bacterium]|nr:DUF3568 family protein [Deltaproteobacteria bacterium]